MDVFASAFTYTFLWLTSTNSFFRWLTSSTRAKPLHFKMFLILLGFCRILETLGFYSMLPSKTEKLNKKDSQH